MTLSYWVLTGQMMASSTELERSDSRRKERMPNFGCSSFPVRERPPSVRRNVSQSCMFHGTSFITYRQSIRNCSHFEEVCRCMTVPVSDRGRHRQSFDESTLHLIRCISIASHIQLVQSAHTGMLEKRTNDRKVEVVTSHNSRQGKTQTIANEL